jgi:hypothetical protein
MLFQNRKSVLKIVEYSDFQIRTKMNGGMELDAVVPE